MGITMKKKYTTIQVDEEFAAHIRKWCKDHQTLITWATRRLWETEISSSVSVKNDCPK